VAKERRSLRLTGYSRGRSPRGLTGYSREAVTAKVEEIEPGKFVHRAPDCNKLNEQVRALLQSCRQTAAATAAVGTKPKAERKDKVHEDDQEKAVRHAAWRVLSRVDGIEAYFNRGGERGLTLALREALRLVAEVHGLTIVDNEPPIADRIASIEAGRLGGPAKAKMHESRNERMALKYEKQWKDEQKKPPSQARRSDTQLKAEIGAAEDPPLKRTASYDAINAGLKLLSRRRGQTERPA
jgi:hypothetical protein